MTFGDRNPDQVRAWNRRGAARYQERRTVKARAEGRFSSLGRGRGPKAVSAKRRASLPERRLVRARVIRRDGGCVLRAIASHECHGELTFHHLRKEGQGGEYVESNGLCCCAGGNGWIEDQPRLARLLGLVVCGEVDEVVAADRRARHGIAPNWRPAQEAA